MTVYAVILRSAATKNLATTGKERSFAALRMTVYAVILRSAATKNLCVDREGKILRCAQDDRGGQDDRIPCHSEEPSDDSTPCHSEERSDEESLR